jgi:glutamyl-Q tRNA(Asp) synthetase
MTGNTPVITRFAPSPTGYLHLGHAWSAIFAQHAAEKTGGQFLLRIEDIDPVRCQSEFTEAIYKDLHWIGLKWPEPVRCQSQHLDDYAKALQLLKDKGVLYPCFCSRREIAEEAAAAGHAPHLGDVEEVIYPGTCRHLSSTESTEKLAHYKTANWRLDVTQALAITGKLTWHDLGRGIVEAAPERFGDVVLARKDVPTSYHLSVTVDDYLQGVTLVTRGEDLFRATDIHRLLQALLDYPTPDYHHHTLLTDETGKRFAKRDKSVTLRTLRTEGKTVEDIRHLLPDL